MGDNISSEFRDDDGDHAEEGESSVLDDESEVSDGEYAHESSRAEAITLRQRQQVNEARLSELLAAGPRLGMMWQEDDDLPGEMFVPLSTDAGLRRVVDQSRRVAEETKLLQEERERAKRSEIARDMKHQNDMEELRRRIEELERRKQGSATGDDQELDSASSSSDEEFQPDSKKKRKFEPRPKRGKQPRGGAPIRVTKKPASFDKPTKEMKRRTLKNGSSETRGIGGGPKPAAASATDTRPQEQKPKKDDEICPICLEPIVDSERGLLEPCMHARYHYQCAMDLYVNHGKCCMHNPAGAITGVKKIYA
jgi:hypothetical protein